MSRLRGLSGSSNNNNNSSNPPSAVSPSSYSANSTPFLPGSDKHKRRTTPKITMENSSSNSDSEDDEIPTIKIVRDRSKSVCMPVMSTAQLRQLHRRASHHVYVAIIVILVYCFIDMSLDKLIEQKKQKSFVIFQKFRVLIFTPPPFCYNTTYHNYIVCVQNGFATSLLKIELMID